MPSRFLNLTSFAIQFGDFGIRWYALAYIAGLLIGIYILRREAQSPGALMTPDQTDHLLNYLLIGHHFWGTTWLRFFLQRQFLSGQPAINSPIVGGRHVLPWRLLGVGFALFLMARRHELTISCGQ